MSLCLRDGFCNRGSVWLLGGSWEDERKGSQSQVSAGKPCHDYTMYQIIMFFLFLPPAVHSSWKLARFLYKVPAYTFRLAWIRHWLREHNWEYRGLPLPSNSKVWIPIDHPLVHLNWCVYSMDPQRCTAVEMASDTRENLPGPYWVLPSPSRCWLCYSRWIHASWELWFIRISTYNWLIFLSHMEVCYCFD